MKHHANVLIVLLLIVSSIGCNQDEEILYAPEPVREINEFIYTNMDTYYYWTDLMPRDINRETEINPAAYFEKLLYTPEDRWSYITSDAQALKNSLDGIETTFGHQYRLFQLPNSDQVFGVVQYVIHSSPAEKAGMRRGDLFYKVNGVPLTARNYAALLFGKTAYALDFGRIEGQEIIDVDRSISLTAQVVQERPVHYANTYEIEGHTIGYILYNQFLTEFEDDLDSVFRSFRAQQVGDLVLDLRYNPGGSASTAAYLASLIAPASATSTGQIFNTYLYNDMLTQYLVENGGENSPSLVRTFVSSEYNLNLDRLYVLVSANTASASELVIHGLSPYMEVILIGPENTSGKYTGSITIEDKEANHGWALQPIISKVANALGETDYINGFPPDYLIEDDLSAQFGTLDEDMFARAVALITGIQGPARTAAMPSVKALVSAGMYPVEQRQKLWLDFQETEFSDQPSGPLD